MPVSDAILAAGSFEFILVLRVVACWRAPWADDGFGAGQGWMGASNGGEGRVMLLCGFWDVVYV